MINNRLHTYINDIRNFLHQDNSYTIVLIPDDGKEIKKKNFSTEHFRKFLYVAVITSTVFASCLGVMSYVIYLGSTEQHDLAEYRKTKQEQEKNIQELTAVTEDMQKKMSMLTGLETQVREQMTKAGMETPADNSDYTKSQDKYAGKGGNRLTSISGVTVLLEQDKNLNQNLKAKIKTWSNLLVNIKSENYKLSVTPTFWPTDSKYVSSDFGSRVDPFDSSYVDYHPGIDIAANYGAPVYASASGYVGQAGWHGGYGKYVRISHDYGYETAYGHLSDISVSSGSYVNKGDIIGNVGSTGYSTGPHLHFEVLLYGEQVNPSTLIK